MHKLLLVPAAALLLVAAKEGKKEERAPLLLSTSDLDPALILAPPPAAGSRAVQNELSMLRAIDEGRTEQEAGDAKALGTIKSVLLFGPAMGPAFDVDRLPVTRSLFETVRAEEKAAVDRAKAHFQRPRPYVTDAGLHPCNRGEDLLSSYPSGHATMAYSMGVILAKLVPSRAPAILARAASYQASRLVCEQHYPSDVAAGQAYGTVIAERLLQQPAFRARFDAAAQELKAAHIL